MTGLAILLGKTEGNTALCLAPLASDYQHSIFDCYSFLQGAPLREYPLFLPSGSRSSVHRWQWPAARHTCLRFQKTEGLCLVSFFHGFNPDTSNTSFVVLTQPVQ